MQHHSVIGGGGVVLRAVEAGNPAGTPILFIHGWSQGAAVWNKQLESPLLQHRFRMIALDLRGHGDSDKPQAGYDDPQAWADDLAAVIAGTGLIAPVLVAWSYGGYVVADYLRAYGDDSICAIVLVAAAVDLGVEVSYARRGDGWQGVLPRKGSADAHAYSPAPHDAGPMRTFVRNCVAAPPSAQDEESMLAINLRVPPHVRGALFARTVAGSDVLGGVHVPVLVIHGERDRIVDPQTARHIAEVIPHAQLSLYPECGHTPFRESPARFERELAAFVDLAADVSR